MVCCILHRLGGTTTSTPLARLHTSSETPPGGKAGGEAFSFPVTPVSEAPAPADAVFGAWPSFHKKRRQVRLAAGVLSVCMDGGGPGVLLFESDVLGVLLRTHFIGCCMQSAYTCRTDYLLGVASGC